MRSLRLWVKQQRLDRLSPWLILAALAVGACVLRFTHDVSPNTPASERLDGGGGGGRPGNGNHGTNDVPNGHVGGAAASSSAPSALLPADICSYV